MKNTKDNFRRLVLPSGLIILLYKIDSVRSVYSVADIKSGSIWESPEERGISHFCEHISFGGTEKFNSDNKINERLEEIGAYSNARTSGTSTRFWIKSPYDSFQESLEMLSQLIFKPSLHEQYIEKEKTIIINEFKGWWQVSDNRFNHISWQKRFKDIDHPYSRNSLGTPETISKITKDKILVWRNKFYTPDNITLSIAGNIDFDKSIEYIKNFFGSEKQKNKNEEPKFTPNDYSDFNIYKEVEDRPQVRFFMSYPAFGWKEVNRYEEAKLRILNYIFGGGPSSRLFKKLRQEENLAYNIGSHCSLSQWLGHFEILGSVSSEKIIQAFELIKKEMNDICKNNVTEKELLLTKKVFHSSYMMKFESSETVAYHLLGEELDYEDIFMPEDYAELFQKIKIEELQTLAKQIFSDKRVNISLFGKVDEINTKEIKEIFLQSP